MGEFFKGWRRKSGVLNLMIACLFAPEWVRSFYAYDAIRVPDFGKVFEKHLVRLNRFEREWKRSCHTFENADFKLAKICFQADGLMLFQHRRDISTQLAMSSPLRQNRGQAPGNRRCVFFGRHFETPRKPDSSFQNGAFVFNEIRLRSSDHNDERATS
jgi:hypothetical protein